VSTFVFGWSSLFFTIGVLLNLIGIIITIKATVNMWHAYGPGPVWPWVHKALSICRVKIKLLHPWRRKGKSVHIQGLPASIAVTSSVSVKLRKRLGFKGEDDSNEKRIRRLEEAVMGLYRELDENKADTEKSNSALRKSIGDLQQKLKEESRRLEAFSKEAVTGDIRLQLRGLLFIGLGTLISSIAQFLG
jgi:hypothetical protein